jgi:hypothetical protein
MITSFVFFFTDLPVVSHGKGSFGLIFLFFCIGLVLIVSKIMAEALAFNAKSVMGYTIDNTLLESRGWSRVRVLVQNTSDDKMLAMIKRWVGQMEKAV